MSRMQSQDSSIPASQHPSIPALGFPAFQHASVRHILAVLFLAMIISGCSGLHLREPVLQKEVRARMDLSKSYLQKRLPRQSLQELLAVQGRAKNNPEFHFLLGLTQMQLKDQKRAAEHFRRAVELDPDYGQAWNNLGQVLIALDRFEEAEQALKRALEIPTYLTPEYPAYNLSRLEQKRGRTDMVLKYAALSLEKNDRYTPASILLSELWLEQGNIPKAIETLQNGVQNSPNNSQLMLSLAENYLRMGQNQNAKQWFKRVLDAAPDSGEAQLARDYLDLLP